MTDTRERTMYLQIEPQAAWHDEAIIRGDSAALLELARAITDAATKTEAVTDWLFASDGEGYHIVVQRVELPDNLPPPFYVCQIEHRNYNAAGVEYCGKCGRALPEPPQSVTETQGE